MTQQTDAPAAAGPPAEPFTQEPAPAGKQLPDNLRDMVERAIELRRENVNLKSRMDNNSAELHLLDPIIIEQFAIQGIRQQKMKTGETVYLERSVYASLVRDDGGEHHGAHQALREYGLEWLVKDKVDSGSLSAWVREQQKQESEIPEGLLPFLKISEVYRVKVRL